MHTEEIKKKKKNEHTFLVFLYIFVNNILLEIISKHIMASSKNKGYNMRKMNVLWGIYNATLLGVDVFLQKKKEERNTFAFWWVICSIIVNTGSVKWLYNMSKLYYKYSHYIHETRVPAFFFFFYALVIWGIFRSIFLSFSPPPFHPLFFSFIPLYFKSIVCVWSEVAGQSVFVPCDLSSFKVSWLWSSQT